MTDEAIPMKPALAVHNKTDADNAAELRAEMNLALQPVITILNRAHQEGFDIAINMQRDQFGRWFLPPLPVSKRF